MLQGKLPQVWLQAIALNVILIGFVTYSQDNGYTTLPLSNDSPFHSSWYKRALDTGMLVWSDMDALSRTSLDDMMPDYRLLVLDASVGRLIYLEYCLQNVFHENNVITKNHSDFGYLARIVAGLYEVCQELDNCAPRDRMGCLKNVLNRIDQHISLLSDE